MTIESPPVRTNPRAPSRRTSYKTQRRQDRWIAPLLANGIDQSLLAFAAPLAAGGMCLDVGCGEQPVREQIENLGLQYRSLDIAQNTRGSVDHIGAIDGTLPQSLDGESFDFIVCTEVLEHVADWPKAFTNLAKLLNPGGRLLITCPHIWLPHEEPHDYYRPTDWALAYHAKRVGLQTLMLRRLGNGYDVLGTVLAGVGVRAPRGQPWLWLIVWPFSLARKLTLALLSIRPLRHLIALPTSLYLSTLAVFEKTSSSN